MRIDPLEEPLQPPAAAMQIEKGRHGALSRKVMPAIRIIPLT
jgi:hypothetical protein